MRRRQRRSSSGFTLLETLVAFAILAIFMTALLQVFGTGLRSLNAADAQAIAMLQARSKLAEVGPLISLTDGPQSGDFENGSTWRLEPRLYEVSATPANTQTAAQAVPYEVEVTVSWGEGKSLSLKTLRLGPAE